MKSRNTLDSFNYAIIGILEGVKRERNVKVHLVASALIMLASYIFHISAVEFAIIVCICAVVITAELINTSVEAIIDLYCGDEYHPLAKLAKDVAAGAVLVSALAAVIIGITIFHDNIGNIGSLRYRMVNMMPMEFTLISIVVVIALTGIIKYKKTGTANLISGGFPSGHSSVSFACATIIFFLTQNVIVIILGYVLAFLVAQSRFEGKIHSFYEVIAGSVMGVLVVILFHQLLM